MLGLKTEAQLYLKKGDFSLAREYFSKAIEIIPDYRDMYVNLARVYFAENNYSKAIDLLEQAINIPPAESDKELLSDLPTSAIYTLLGNAYKLRREYQQALSAFNKVLELDPKSYIAYFEIGNIYKLQRKYDKAIEFYQKAIHNETDVKRAYINMLVENLDYFKEDSKHYNEIKKQLDKGITEKDVSEYDSSTINRNPNRRIILYQIYNNLGNIYYEQKRFDDANEQFKKAIQVRPDKSPN